MKARVVGAAVGFALLALAPSARAGDEAQERPGWDARDASLRFDGAWSPRRLYSLPVNGADLGVAAGSQPFRHAAFWGTPRLFLGSTENGLSVWSASVGVEAELVLGRVRVGAGASVFALGVHRAARSETILSFGPEGRASARLDVVQSEGFALFARASLSGGWEIYDDAIFWGPSLGLGVALDLGED